MSFFNRMKSGRLATVLMTAAAATLSLVAALDLSGAQISKADPKRKRT